MCESTDAECKEIQHLKTLCGLPATKRGYGLNMYYHTKKAPAEFVYASGKAVCMRSFEDPSEARSYSHQTYVTAANISTKGNWVASIDEHGHIKIFGRKEGNKIMMKCEHDSLSSGNDICWDGDDKRLAVCGQAQAGGTYAKVIDAFSGSALGNVDGIVDNCTSIDYRKVRPFRVVVSSEHNDTRTYAGPPFKFVPGSNIEKHTRYANKVKYSHDGAFYISVGSDSKIFLCEAKEGTFIREIGEGAENGHKGSAIYGFDWSADDKEIVTCSADKTCKIWNVESGEVLTTFTIAETPKLDDMQLGCIWSGDNIFSVSLSGAINILDRENPSKPKDIIHGHKATIKAICSKGTDGTFFTSCGEGRISHWKDCKASWLNSTIQGGVHLVELDGEGRLISTGSDKKLHISESAEGKVNSDGLALPSEAKFLAGGNATGICAVALSSKLLIVKDGAVAKEIKFDKDITCIKFNHDDSLIAVGHKGKHVVVYTTDEGKEAHKVDGTDYTKAPSCLEWSPEGKYLCVGASGGTFIYDTTADYKQVNPSDWEFHRGAVAAICWAKDNSKVVTVGTDLTIIKWTDLEKFSTKRSTLKMSHFHGVTGAALIDNERLVTVGQDACMRVWGV